MYKDLKHDKYPKDTGKSVKCTNLVKRLEVTYPKMKMTMTALIALIEAMDGVDSAGK